MTLVVTTDPVPLSTDPDGVVRVAHTRITLDTVVAAFLEGATAEEIVQQYPALHLADVYAVISYYLRYQDEVHAYLLLRQQQAAFIRAQNEARFLSTDVRARLLARRQQQG